ncbi:MAG TPA: lysozyme, partial [Kaistella sp.]|nr:lysozyme [Kaistella sp.]
MKITKTSKKGIDLIKKYEGLHDGDLTKVGLQPKLDPVGIWTEGYGRAMRDEKGNFLKGIKNKSYANAHATIKTECEAEKALAEDVAPFEKLVIQKIKVELNQNQFDALVVMFYNIGFSATLTNLINSGADKKVIY